MRLLIATPLYPPAMGGPATYAKELEAEFNRRNVENQVVSFGDVLHLPKGISHVTYLLRLVFSARGSDVIVALDPFAVGISAIVAGWLWRIPVVARIGGDSVWEHYVNRTHISVSLALFYEKYGSTLNYRERIMFVATKYFYHHAQRICFSTKWQLEISRKPYQLNSDQVCVLENAFFPTQPKQSVSLRKVFLWAGREIFIKNTTLLKRAFAEAKKINPDVELDMVQGIPRADLLNRMKNSYALILPSLSDISPNYIKEGISVGIPFIMTTETGERERLQGFGIFVEPLNEAGWIDAIVSMADSETYRKYVSAIEHRNISRTYVDIADEIMDIIRPLI